MYVIRDKNQPILYLQTVLYTAGRRHNIEFECEVGKRVLGKFHILSFESNYVET